MKNVSPRKLLLIYQLIMKPLVLLLVKNMSLQEMKLYVTKSVSCIWGNGWWVDMGTSGILFTSSRK